MNLNVIKRDGTKEPINMDKIHRVITWGAENLSNVSVSQVELNAKIQLFDGILTSDIHKTLIKSASNLISAETPDYQYLAARLAIFQIRKQAFGKFIPPTIYEHVSKMVETGWYDKSIFDCFTKEEIDEFEDVICHNRDMDFAYAGVEQLEGKYLVRDKKSGTILESPQFVFLMIPMYLFGRIQDKAKRKQIISDFYYGLSTFKFSLPTPIMGGVRTKTKQFSSCVLIDCGDSLESINATTSGIVSYASKRAGIGINAGRLRGLNTPIRNGEALHTGCIPFFKLFQAATHSCSQGGIRKGAADIFYPLWHMEVESLLVLKNNRGVEDNRVRHMDYGVQLNGLMYQRLIKNQDITLFSPYNTPGLYDAFFNDQKKFEELYTKYENDPEIKYKKTVKAVDLFSTLMQERASTGRIYIQHVDHCNTHGSFIESIAPIYQSNLCLEITLPTKPLNDIHDPEGEIALCTLAAVNVGRINSFDEMEWIADLLVRGLDELLDYQDYPVIAAERSTMYRRSLGIGIIGLAHDLARKGLKYSDGSANNYVHEMFEAYQYYLLKASNKLAKEKGACPGFKETKYSLGILPIDTYKKDIDRVHSAELKLDWESLRKEIVEHGLRNSTLSALMPSESSSQVSNATNGIEPPRGFVTVKASKDGILRQVVPDIETLRDAYELLWEIPDNKGILNLVGIMQKFVDQAISTNTNYDPTKFEGEKVSMNQLLKDLLLSYKNGVKTLYYHNTRDGAKDDQNDIVEDDGCDSGACKI